VEADVLEFISDKKAGNGDRRFRFRTGDPSFQCPGVISDSRPGFFVVSAEQNAENAEKNTRRKPFPPGITLWIRYCISVHSIKH